MELKTLLEKELQQTQATFGIAVTHLETGEQVSINGDQLFQMASTFKVPILAALLDEVDKGTLTLDEEVTITEEDFVSGSGVIVQLHDGVKLTIKDLAMLMIIVSDNLATDCLLHRIGMDTVNKFIQQHGYGKIYVHQMCKELLSVMVG